MPDPPELKLQETVSCLIWVLGSELLSSAKSKKQSSQEPSL